MGAHDFPSGSGSASRRSFQPVQMARRKHRQCWEAREQASPIIDDQSHADGFACQGGGGAVADCGASTIRVHGTIPLFVVTSRRLARFLLVAMRRAGGHVAVHQSTITRRVHAEHTVPDYGRGRKGDAHRDGDEQGHQPEYIPVPGPVTRRRRSLPSELRIAPIVIGMDENNTNDVDTDTDDAPLRILPVVGEQAEIVARHECGHAVVALVLGCRVTWITLNPCDENDSVASCHWIPKDDMLDVCQRMVHCAGFVETGMAGADYDVENAGAVAD